MKFVARSSNVVALTFRCGSRYGSPGPICHLQMGRHGSWEVFDQTNLDHFVLRVFCKIRSFPDFHLFVWISMVSICLGGAVDYQESVWRQLGRPGTILDVFCDKVTFQEIPKSSKSTSQVFPVRNFDDTRWTRCGIAARSFHNLRFIQTRFWGLAGVIRKPFTCPVDRGGGLPPPPPTPPHIFCRPPASMENPWEIHGQIQGFGKPRFVQKVKVWKQVGRFL